MRVFGQYEQQAIDQLWHQRTGLPPLLLMEAAASAVMKTAWEIMPATGSDTSTILILAGKGNNGGDAFACARLLIAAGHRVVCRELFPEAELPPDVKANRQALLGMGGEIGPLHSQDFDSLATGSLIIDGIFGTGFHGGRPLPESVREASRQIAAARHRGAMVLAIDVPSGLDADSGCLETGAVQADVTVTFVRNKIGLCAAPGRFLAGRVVVAPIGVPEAWIDDVPETTGENGVQTAVNQINGEDIRAVRPERPDDSHKGQFGRVLILGGASGMPGAVLLAAEAAARSGAGLVTVAVPESIGSLVLSSRPEGLLHLLPGTDRNDGGQHADLQHLADRLLETSPAVAVGMGAGQAGWLSTCLPGLIRQADRLVLDADALNRMAADPDLYFDLLRSRCLAGMPPAILTPHPGEFRRLMPNCRIDDRQKAARVLSEASASVVVLKGASTVVAVPEGPVWINPTGNHGLAKGGSGDVLAGLTAGLLAQGLSTEMAAVAAVYLHGLAADLAAGRLGRRSLLASDVIASFGEAFRDAGWESR